MLEMLYLNKGYIFYGKQENKKKQQENGAKKNSNNVTMILINPNQLVIFFQKKHQSIGILILERWLKRGPLEDLKM